MRILIALDASAASRKVVDYLLKYPAVFKGPTLCVLYVDPPPALRAVGAFGADPGMPALPPGDPGPEITQIATDGAYDLIVMGAGERGLLRRKLLGSVAHTVLSHSTTPMLIVR